MAQQRVDNMVKGATKRSEDLEDLRASLPEKEQSINVMPKPKQDLIAKERNRINANTPKNGAN